MHKNLILLAVYLLLSSCSTVQEDNLILNNFTYQKEAVLQGNEVISAVSSASRKLHDIAWQIMKANKGFCLKANINAFGLMASSYDDLEISLQPSFWAATPNINNNHNKNFIEFPMIISVAKNSPAEEIGLLEGDLIYAISGNKNLKNNFRSLLKNAENNNFLNITVLRNEKYYTYELKAETICGYPVQVMISPIPNAYADGSKIFITIATLDFIENDQELAFLIGHELVHNIYHYGGNGISESEALPLTLTDSPSLRSLGDIFVFQTGTKESEADLLGVEFVLRAGIRQDKAANYFRRLSIYMPILMKDSLYKIHPGNIKRAVEIDIKAKKFKEGM